MKKNETSLLVRMSKKQKTEIDKASKQKNMPQSVFVRRAIEKAMPKFCVCGNHWGHTGKHFVQEKTFFPEQNKKLGL